MRLGLRIMEVIVPSFTAKRVEYLEFTRAKIEKRLDLKTDRKDFMTYASFRLILRHNGERGMTHVEIIGTSRAILAAGAETTASLLSAATYYLLEQNPDMLHRVQSEVRTAFKTGDEITLRAVSKPGLLPYLEAVLRESLRCFPPVPTSLPRKVGGAGAVIDGYSVPKDVCNVQ
ncbi:MAG: hypothetical protein Q9171_006965 [Xanthocarpia ochracea]